MNFRWTMRRLHRWGISRRKLRGGFIHSKLGDRVLERELWFPSRESLARAWLIGMPVTTLPFLPLQSAIACSIGFYFRANLPVCFMLQYLSNPATAIFQLSACYFVGRLLFGESPSLIVKHVEQVVGRIVNAESWTAAFSVLTAQEFVALFLGGLVLGLFLGLLGYGLTHLIWKDKPRKKKVSTSPLLTHPHLERHPLHPVINGDQSGLDTSIKDEAALSPASPSEEAEQNKRPEAGES